MSVSILRSNNFSCYLKWLANGIDTARTATVTQDRKKRRPHEVTKIGVPWKFQVENAVVIQIYEEEKQIFQKKNVNLSDIAGS